MMIANLACQLTMSLALGASNESLAYLELRDGFWQVSILSADGSASRPVTHSAGDKTRVSWYPDGKRLLVNGADGKIYRVDVASGQETLIRTELSGFQDAVLSPDGKRIAFSLSTSGSVDDHDIWLVNEDGTALRKLTTMPWLQHEPAWSADARYVYFLSGSGGQVHDIWRVGVSDRRTEQLTSNQLYHFDVTVAKDGRLAFSSNRSGNYDIWIRTSAGDDRPITQDAALDARPEWSADGKRLFFESSSGGGLGIWSIDIDGSHRKRLTSAEGQARFPVVFDAGVTP